ncbi:MAG: hypothetical protein QM703_05285 [Gemmatales bacterium]
MALKHNQAIEVAEDEYKLFTTSFFSEHLVTETVTQSMPAIELQPVQGQRRGSSYSTAGI